MNRAIRENSPAREQILETAAQLFYREGFRAVGIDRIIAESGVAKMTLYKHFPSKDDLIVAYLERSNQHFWKLYAERVEPLPTARERLEALFDWVAERAVSPACLGCTFSVNAAEFPSLDSPSHQAAIRHKQAILQKLEELGLEAGAKDPRGLAESLLLLMDGAWNAARMFGPGSHAGRVAEAAKMLICQAIP